MAEDYRRIELITGEGAQPRGKRDAIDAA